MTRNICSLTRTHTHTQSLSLLYEFHTVFEEHDLWNDWSEQRKHSLDMGVVCSLDSLSVEKKGEDCHSDGREGGL